MKLPLSDRLLACAGFVTPGSRVADIGCDHGYLGIHLLQNGLASSMIESDINEAPLQSALHNAHKYGVADKMSFYLSDGVSNIPRDFDTLICAGMGADTMIHILDSAPWLKDRRYKLILQCQSKRPELRKYLYANGYSITRETLAQDGKFIYPITEVVYESAEPLSPAGYHITPALLCSGSELLPAFLERVMFGLQTSVNGLSRTGGEKYEELKAILEELQKIQVQKEERQ